MSQYNGPTLPMNKPPRKTRVNGGSVFTLILVLAIAVMMVLIIKDMKDRRNNGPAQITDLYGGSVTYMNASPVPTQRDKRPVSDDPELLPVFYSADTDDKAIAITVQNLGSAENIDKLLELCDACGAHLTFFPTGKEVLASPGIWGAVIFGGHEIENHGYSGNRLSVMGTDARREEINGFTETIRMFVGEEYEPHFLRTNDLSDDANAEVHAFLMEQNYLGIARWSAMAPSSIEEVRPGQIMMIDLSEYGVQKLGNVMNVLKESGWKMLTMNELFDYPPNIVSSADFVEE